MSWVNELLNDTIEKTKEKISEGTSSAIGKLFGKTADKIASNPDNQAKAQKAVKEQAGNVTGNWLIDNWQIVAGVLGISLIGVFLAGRGAK